MSIMGTKDGGGKVVHVNDRNDVRSVWINTYGVYSDDLGVRGVEVVAIITYDDGETERRVYDFLAGPDPDAAYGGWDINAPFVAKIVDGACEWIRNDLEPPCAPVAS